MDYLFSLLGHSTEMVQAASQGSQTAVAAVLCAVLLGLFS